MIMQSMHIMESVEAVSFLDQERFRNTIIDERKRSERSGRAFILLLAWVNGEMRETDLMFGARVLATLKTDIDQVGWFETGRTVGLLVPEIDPGDLQTVRERLKLAWEDALVRASTQDAAPVLFFDLRLYPERITAEGLIEDFVDPYLHPELSLDRNTGAIPTVKRIMDLALSGVLLVLLSPLFLALAGLVKCSSRGPVLFRQVRVGHRMKPFVMYKFRTMYVDVDHQVHQDYVSWFITSSAKAQSTSGNALFKLENDPRITPIGRVLRKTSLDEFPQFWNVLIGEMSLVGPRPPLPYEVEQYQPWHRGRVMEAKPGITGLWQVVGRSRTTFDEMVRLDLQYARSMSLLFDLKILFATPGAMISGKGAR